jgi:hypothetical protein
VWLLVLFLCVGILGTCDSIVLELGTTFFTAGFNAVYVGGWQALFLYWVTSLLLDLWLVLGLWAALLLVFRKIGLSRTQSLGFLAFATVALPISFIVFRFNLTYVLGNLLHFEALWELAGGSAEEMASQAMPHVGFLVIWFASLAAAAVVAWRVVRWIETRWEPAAGSLRLPSVAFLAVPCAVAGLLAAGLLSMPSEAAKRVRFGISKKASGTLMLAAAHLATDFDRDGVGALSLLHDPAPFDSSVHPYALDLPGNGVDENGLAGDHPPGFQPISTIVDPEPRAQPEDRPHVLLILLEGFRADLIGAGFRGRPVTPFLTRLGRSGASSQRTYVNSPWTAGSRAQLFGGRLAPYLGQDTLIDDFKQIGYVVAYFSGQNELHGNGEQMLGVDRSDVFYDARQDIDRRTSRSTSPVSLQVSWKLLLERATGFLDGHDPAVPLFMYVNIVDTHFPYHHDELDRILEVEPMSRHEIRADRAEEIWETYLNTAANVDRAAERLVDAWWRKLGHHGNAIIVTADHGESIYDDDGFLGHGRSLRAPQTRVPLIVWGLGGEWPEPIGLSDLRGLISRSLRSSKAAPTQHLRFVREPARRLLQFTPQIDTPSVIGLRAADWALMYSFEADLTEVLGPGDHPAEWSSDRVTEAFELLVRNWEAVRSQARLDRP